METNEQPNARIQITKDGPYLVSGALPLAEQWIVTNTEGESLGYREGKKYPPQQQYALCRCGRTSNRPFCDGTHKKVKFDGTETASREPYLNQAEKIEGSTMVLTDAESLCAFARFCDPKGRIWNLVKQTDNPEARLLVEQQAGHCPSGRLVAWDRGKGQAIEPKFEPSLGLIEDTAKKVSGPIWVRGGIPIIAADGKTYEIRNRMTLCRCGRSSNKPFCDGTHAA
jgi:CDGSH-type Zn-finger protein